MAFQLALEEDLNDEQVGILAANWGLDLIYVLARRKLITSGLARERVVELVNSRIPTLVAFCMSCSCLKEKDLSRFIAHPCASVRQALTYNEGISQAMLEQLMEDEDKNVAGSAKQHFEEVSGKKELPEKEETLFPIYMIKLTSVCMVKLTAACGFG